MSLSDHVGLITELEQKLVSGSPKSDKPQKQDLVSAEIKGLARHLNHELAHDDLVADLLPIRIDDIDLLDKVCDGVLHCAFIRSIAPDSIPLHKIISTKMKGRPLNTFEMQANQRLYIDAAVNMGLVVVNIGDKDLIDARHHVSLVLGLLWQLLDRQLRIRTGLNRSPRQKQSLDEHKQLVINWVNDRLSATSVRMTNFSTDLQDGRLYLMLLKCISSSSLPVSKPNHFNDDLSRAQAVISTILKMGISPLLDESDILLGHEQLNLAFIQNLIAYCRSRDEELMANEYIESMEAQANINIDRVRNDHVSVHDRYLMFYLGMNQQLVQICRNGQPLFTTCIELKIRPETKSTHHNHSVPILDWLLAQFRYGTAYYIDDGHRKVSVHADHTSDMYWAVSLLPGFESIGLLFTCRNQDRHCQYPNLIPAFIATAIGRTVIGPIETLQIRQQVNGNSHNITKQLYKGHSANLARLLPYAYIQFITCNHDHLTQGQYSSLIMATGLATLITYPLDVAQTQMAASTAPGGISRYLWNSVRIHGLIPGLSRGVLPHVLGATTFISMHLLTEPHLTQIFRPELGGLLSFMTSLIATYPARTISRCMQIGLLQKQPLRSMSHIANTIVQREGLQGLYKGILPALAKTGPAYLFTAAAYQALYRSSKNP